MSLNPSISAGILSSIQIPGGPEIYDALMGKIDPDLLTVNVSHLDEKYAGETPEQKQTRLQRYRTAYEAYDAAFRAWVDQVQGTMNVFRSGALHAAERQDRAALDAPVLATLESQLRA